MSSFDLRKFLTENKLTPNTQGYKIIRDETKRITLKEGALEGDPSTWKQLPSKGSPNRQAWDDLWRTIATYTRDRKLNVRKIINGGGHIRISFKDGSELRIVPGMLQLYDRNTHKRTKIGPENAATVCEKFDTVGVKHLTFNDPANRRGGAMNHKEVSSLQEGKRRNLSEAQKNSNPLPAGFMHAAERDIYDTIKWLADSVDAEKEIKWNNVIGAEEGKEVEGYVDVYPNLDEIDNGKLRGYDIEAEVHLHGKVVGFEDIFGANFANIRVDEYDSIITAINKQSGRASRWQHCRELDDNGTSPTVTFSVLAEEGGDDDDYLDESREKPLAGPDGKYNNSFDYFMDKADEEPGKWEGAKDGDEELRSLGIIREDSNEDQLLQQVIQNCEKYIDSIEDESFDELDEMDVDLRLESTDESLDDYWVNYSHGRGAGEILLYSNGRYIPWEDLPLDVKKELATMSQNITDWELPAWM